MSRGTLGTAPCTPYFAYGAITLSGPPSQGRSAVLMHAYRSPEPHHARMVVWALPIPLAATLGIDLSFFSSGYLDVSVHQVSPRTAMDSLYGT